MKKVLNVIAALFLVLVLTTPSWAQTVRYEAELADITTSATMNQVVGYAMGVGHGALYYEYADAALSNGKGVYTALAGADAKLVFLGTGVDMIAPTIPGAADFVWVLDEGVTTGAASQNLATGSQTVIPLVSGLTNTIHTLLIDKEPNIAFRDNANAKVLRLDAFDVYDSGTRLRIDDGDTSAVLQTGSAGAVRYSDGGWAYQVGTAGNWLGSAYTASGGSSNYTTGAGQWAKVDFTGAGIVMGITLREVSHDVAWNLDNAFDGTISDIRLDSDYGWGIHWRWPYLISNQLAPGSHTLTVSCVPVTGGVLLMTDYFDTIAEAVPVELSSFEVE